MARKTFSISAGVNQELDDIGAMAPSANATGGISPERIAQLQELMAKPTTAAVKTDNNDSDNDRLDEILPANSEQFIAIEKLIAAPDEWNFFGRPTQEQYALIFQSIYTYGLWHPVTVWEQEDGTYMILGGHTRSLVYKELYAVTNDEKYLKIPCKIYKHDQINKTTARRIIILTNIAQRAQESPKIRIRCYCEMARLEKEDAFYGSGIDVNTAVAKLFGVGRSTVAFYRRLEKLIAPLLSVYESNQISRTVVLMLTDISEELQEYIYTKKYYLQLTPAMKNGLKNAVTTYDIDKLIEEAAKKENGKYKYSFSTRVEKPKDFDFIPLAVNHDEVEAFKEFLAQSLDLADGLSDKTKQVIRDMIE